DRALRDHLVRIHVLRGAGPHLERIDRTLRIPRSVDDLLRRAGDRLGGLGLEQAEGGVDLRGGALDRRGGRDERAGKPEAADGKVFDRADGLGTVVGVGRDPDVPQGVALDPVLSVGAHRYPPVWVSRGDLSIPRPAPRQGRWGRKLLSPGGIQARVPTW